MTETMDSTSMYLTSLISGGAAGFVVDVVLFPLDTLKTRMQSAQGFFQAGGFHNVYKGLLPQALGSAPTAALFFCTYDAFKRVVTPLVPKESLPLVYMAGASISEVVACLIRVPVEVVKQRRQTSIGNRKTALVIFCDAYTNEGLFKGVYRGFCSTVMREVPFSLIQLPLWEFFKAFWSTHLNNGEPISPWEVAVCGALAGGISASITTPLDVAKTRIILADKNTLEPNNFRVISVLQSIYREQGCKGLFAGVAPRTMWITLGGALFFGTYELVKNWCTTYFTEQQSVSK